MLEYRNGNTYAYWSKRIGKRVVRTYLGRGEIAVAGNHYITVRRAFDRSMKRVEREKREDQLRQTDKRAADVATTVLTLVTSALTMAGYHRIKRGPWRRKRGVQVVNPSINEAVAGMTAQQAHASGQIQAWLNDRYARAMAGDKGAERELFPPDDRPAKPAKRERTVGTLPGAARRNLIDLVTRDDESYDTILREVKQVEADLAGENPSPIVKLIASLAAACYADWWIADGHGKRMVNSPSEAKERYRARAYRRYVAALKTLAQVKRLESNMPTTIKVVGTGPQQINMGQPGTSSAGMLADHPTPPIGNG